MPALIVKCAAQKSVAIVPREPIAGPSAALARALARLSLFAVIALVLALSRGQAVSAQRTPVDPAANSMGASDSPIRAPYLTDLIAQAQAKGSTRVIVGLRSAFLPEGRLVQPGARQAQRTAIARAQDALLGSLANRNARITRRFTYSPHIALQIDADALRLLSTSPSVASITSDHLLHPSLDLSTPLIGATNAWGMGYPARDKPWPFWT